MICARCLQALNPDDVVVGVYRVSGMIDSFINPMFGPHGYAHLDCPTTSGEATS